MRNLENFEMQAVGGAVIRYAGCTMTVSSKGVSPKDFGVIEQNLQAVMDGRMTNDAAAMAIVRAGVSQNSLDAYERNMQSASFICA
jgi:hypothetical protein